MAKTKRKRGRPRKAKAAHLKAAPAGKLKGPSKPLANLLMLISHEDMTALSSLYLDPIDGGFKISLWSGKKGIVEGFVAEDEMPPFVRKALVKRTESMRPGESIEVIGRREDDIALIASEPIDAHANGSLMADIADKDGEIHLKITLAVEEMRPLSPEEAPSPEELDANIEKLTEIVNREMGGMTKLAEFEKEALKLIKDMEESEKLRKKPKDRKTIEKVLRASESLAELSDKYGLTRISHLSKSLSVLFSAYKEKGSADEAAAPIIRETVQMIKRIVAGFSGGSDVDSLVKKISRKD